MPWIAWPSLASRTRPTKLARPPTSRRPRVSASSSRPTSKSSFCTRTRSTSAAGDRGKERDLVAGLHGGGEVGHLLVHGDAPLLAGSERLGPTAFARTKLVQERRHRVRRAGERHLLA